jgi:nucleoside-diphosphate-sugar epimerase
MKKILVTGDSGYIGSTLVLTLIKNGYKVVGLDTNYFTTVLGSMNEPNYTRIIQDVRNISEDILDGIDGIIHLAALSNDPMGDLSANLTEEINYNASVRLAKLAKKAGVKRFLFSSSCSIYGIADAGIVDETSQTNPLTAYAKSKIDTERVLMELADTDFCVGLLRNSTVYGYSPKFRNDLVVNNLTTTGFAYGEIKVMSDGTPWRPLIDVRDLSIIFSEFLTVASEKINGKVINIGFNQNNFQVKQLVEAVQKNLPHCKTTFTGEHGKDSRSYKVNFDTFQSIFPHIKQRWTIEKSITHLIEQLKIAHFNKNDFISGKYSRLSVLKKLMEDKKIDQNLYWV